MQICAVLKGCCESLLSEIMGSAQGAVQGAQIRNLSGFLTLALVTLRPVGR